MAVTRPLQASTPIDARHRSLQGVASTSPVTVLRCTSPTCPEVNSTASCWKRRAKLDRRMVGRGEHLPTTDMRRSFPMATDSKGRQEQDVRPEMAPCRRYPPSRRAFRRRQWPASAGGAGCGTADPRNGRHGTSHPPKPTDCSTSKRPETVERSHGHRNGRDSRRRSGRDEPQTLEIVPEMTIPTRNRQRNSLPPTKVAASR